MSGGKHTAGPWQVVEHSWCETSISAPNFDHGICCLDINHATEESQAADEALMAANARLIAAAPDLLEALQLMLEQFTKTPSTLKDSEARIKAHAALSRATGRKS